MPDVIPLVPSQANYRLSTSLGDEQVSFDVRWNARDSAWYFDLLRSDETPIARGIKIVLGVNLGRQSTDQFFSQNLLHAFDTSLRGREATFDDMGTRVLLVRYSRAELTPTVGEG